MLLAITSSCLHESGRPEGLPVRFLGCQTEPPTDAAGTLFPRGAEEHVFDPVTAQGGRLFWWTDARWKGRVGPGQGVLSLEGYVPHPIAWQAGIGGLSRCEPEVIALQPADSFVSGHVRSPDGGSVSIVGCGGYAESDAQGAFRMAVLPGGDCQIWAGREAGGRWGLPVTVRPLQGGELSVYLSAIPPIFRAFRVEVIETREGLQVVASPDEEKIGDVWLTIDGQPIRKLPSPIWGVSELLQVEGEHVISYRRGKEIESTSIYVSRSDGRSHPSRDSHL